ncbi:MAG: di-heme oxidoreductase family protein [Paracoccaceae bacterium]
MIRTALIAALLAQPVLAPSALAETAQERRARILAPTTDFTTAEPFEALQGGSGTNRTRMDANAFSLPSAALDFEARADFFVGNGVFDRPWVAAPASTTGSDGLGPMFNARSCQGCHIKDGRGHPPEAGERSVVSMVFALSDPEGAPDRVLGRQLQDQAVTGHASEGRISVRWYDVPFAYPDGTEVTLRRPDWSTDAALSPGTALGARVAPPMIGLGLVEAIADADLAANADPDDADGDGISGRLSMTDAGPGRFGWKAASPSLAHQTATAFSLDMGLSTRLETAPWGDCTETQVECRGAPHGDGVPVAGGAEIADELLDLVVFYSAHLAVPARRAPNDPQVLAGKRHFYEAQCAACHVPKFATRADAATGQANQLIWPYSDFLLHDMGPGLADANPIGDAAGAEWRTPPLWGIGLTEVVGGQANFLHDGRARTLEEAILWHGGEAAASRDAFAALTAAERADLISFLEDL